MSHLTDSQLETISDLLAAGNIGNARKIVRLLRREPREGAVTQSILARAANYVGLSVDLTLFFSRR